jgi:hypothetical protein
VQNVQHSGHAPVAQMDRAFASGAKGRRFESCQAYHDSKELSSGKVLHKSTNSYKLHAPQNIDNFRCRLSLIRAHCLRVDIECRLNVGVAQQFLLNGWRRAKSM